MWEDDFEQQSMSNIPKSNQIFRSKKKKKKEEKLFQII